MRSRSASESIVRRNRGGARLSGKVRLWYRRRIDVKTPGRIVVLNLEEEDATRLTCCDGARVRRRYVDDVWCVRSLWRLRTMVELQTSCP